MDTGDENALSAVFYTYCAYGKRGTGSAVTVLEGRQFSKMMKECKIINKRFTPTSADILFAKYAKRSKTISQAEWLMALGKFFQLSIQARYSTIACRVPPPSTLFVLPRL